MKLIQYVSEREHFIDSKTGRTAILNVEGLGEPVTKSTRDTTRVYHLDKWSIICTRYGDANPEWRVDEIFVEDTGHIVDRLTIEDTTDLYKHLLFVKD